MSNKEILISNLLEPGTMFRMTDKAKDNTFSPGSLGFVSFTKGIDESYQNVARKSVIMIRRGKTGKPRLMAVTLSVPVFYVDHKSFDKLMPKAGSKKYYAHIERRLPVNTDIMTLSALEFLGYAAAITRHLKYMSDQCRHKRWPETNHHPINAIRRLPEHFDENPEVLMEKFGVDEFRDDFVIEARKMVSALARMRLKLDITQAETEINAAEFLLFTNKGEFIPEGAEDKTNEYEFTDDNAMLGHTISHYKKVHNDITKLHQNKRKKNS